MEFDGKKSFLKREFYRSFLEKKDSINSLSKGNALDNLVRQLYINNFESIDFDLVRLAINEPSIHKISSLISDGIEILFPKYLDIDLSSNLNFNFEIKEKGVLIIGPGSYLVDDAFDISDYTIVRFNSLGGDADISYCSSYFYENNKDLIENNINLGLLKRVVVNGNPKKLAVSRWYLNRIFPVKSFVFQLATPLLGANRALFDLLSNGVKKITICNVDFYTNTPLHSSKYLTTLKSESDYLESLYIHDIVYNFLIFKRLAISNCVDGDSKFKHLMELDAEAYSKQVNRAFFNQFGG